MTIGRLQIAGWSVAWLPSKVAIRERELLMERDTARLMLIGLAAEITKGQKRVSKDVERLLAKFEPVVRGWDEGGSK
jgi:hypothetical protein